MNIIAKTLDDGKSFSRDIGKEVVIIDFVCIGGSVYGVCVYEDGRLSKKSIDSLKIQEGIIDAMKHEE